MNEMMIQEAVLNSIDMIDDAQIFAEFDVIMSMAAVYEKSAMIQEQAENLSFDGFSIIQEADEASDEKPEPGRVTKYGEKLKEKGGVKKAIGTVITWIGRALDTIMRGIRFVATKLGSVFKKLRKNKVTQQDVKNLVENGAEVKLDETAQEAFDLPAVPTVADVKKASTAKAEYKEKDRKNRQYNKDLKAGGTHTTTVSIEHIEIAFVFNYHLGALLKAYEKVDVAASLLNDVFNKPDEKGVIDQFKDAIKKAKQYFTWAKEKGRSYKEPYAEAYKVYEEMMKYLKSASGRIAECKKELDQLTNDRTEEKYSKGNGGDIHTDMDRWIMTIRACVSEATTLVAGMTKESADFYKYMSKFLNTAQTREKVAAALDEADEDERFGLKPID